MRKERGDYHGRGARPAARGGAATTAGGARGSAAAGGAAAPVAAMPGATRTGASSGRQSAAIALAVAFAVALALRLAPLGVNPRGDLLADSAFHLRMIEEVVAHGHVPALDRMCEAPEGRAIATMLPTGLYHATAWLHRALAPFDHRDARAHALIFTAFAGALIVVPVFFAARALFAAPRAAFAAALLAAVIPAHLHRTYALWLRYDALGSLLATAHLTLLLFALASPDRLRSRIWAGFAALALVAAAACWRVVLVLPLLEVLFAILWTTWRGATREVREPLTIVIGLSTLLFHFVPYLRTQPFVLSSAWLTVFAVTLSMWLPWLAPGPQGGPRRALLIGLAAAAGAVVARLAARIDPYAATFALVPAKLALAFGAHPDPSPIVSLQLSIQELASLPPLGLFGPSALSWLAPWFIAAPFLLAREAGGNLRRRLASLTPAPALFAVLCVAMTLVTLLFERNKVLLGPLVAIACGGLPMGFAARGRGAATARALAILLVVCEAVAAYHAAMLAISRRPAFAPAYREALEFLRDRTPRDAIVMSPWEHGYELQTCARRASVTDGLIESAENQRRIVAFAEAAMTQTPDSLAALCRSHGAEWLLVPPSTHLYGVATVARAPIAAKVLAGVPLKPAEADRALVQMMVLGREYPGFARVFERDQYRIYRVTPP
jgi:oligosaccharyl transferase STT3 subunit